jgi:putative peptidoglycan lipid II flippase
MVKKLFEKSANWLQKEHQSILSAAAIISVSYLASACLGLVKNRLLADRFFGGLEAELDVYFAALVIPDTIFQLLVVGALSAAFVPIYQDYLHRSKEAASELVNATLTTFLIILSFLTLLLFIFAVPVANLMTHFPPDKTLLMANLIRLMSFAQILFTISAFLTGVLQSHRRFLIPAIAPLFYNLGVIVSIYFFSSSLGIYSTALGMILGAILHLLIQLPQAKSIGFSPRLLFSPRHPGSLSILHLMPPRSAALGIAQIERFVAVNLASILAAGSLTIFNFARQLYLLPISLFGVALGQAAFPSLSQEVSAHNPERFRQTLSKSLLQVIFFSLPASVVLLIMRIPLVRLAFGADNFPWDATLLTGKALAILAITIAPQATTQILVRAFYARKDTKTPLLVSSLTIVVFALLGFFLTTTTNLGVIGIALALSISNSLDFILLYYLLGRQIGRLGLSFRIFKMFIASFFTAVFLWLPMRLLDQFVFDTTRTLPLILLTLIVSLIGGLVYLGLSALFQVEELSEVRSIIKKLGNWRRILSGSQEVIESPGN